MKDSGRTPWDEQSTEEKRWLLTIIQLTIRPQILRHRQTPTPVRAIAIAIVGSHAYVKHFITCEYTHPVPVAHS